MTALLTIIGRPFAGRKVTRRLGHTACPGLSWKLKRFTIEASTSVASCSAKVDPMHLRGPAPNGRYAKRSIAGCALPRKRCGSSLKHMDDPAGRNYFANILTIDTFRIQKLKRQFHRLVPVRYPTKRRQARQPRRQKNAASRKNAA